jgi:hypothetical protein
LEYYGTLIRFRFGLTEEQLTKLSDEEFLDRAAEARFINEMQRDIVRDGILEAWNAINGG